MMTILAAFLFAQVATSPTACPIVAVARPHSRDLMRVEWETSPWMDTECLQPTPGTARWKLYECRPTCSHFADFYGDDASVGLMPGTLYYIELTIQTPSGPAHSGVYIRRDE